MVFNDSSEYVKKFKLNELIVCKTEKEPTYILKTNDGQKLKQATMFEDTKTETGKHTSGAWFTSRKDAIFLTKEDISKLIGN